MGVAVGVLVGSNVSVGTAVLVGAGLGVAESVDVGILVGGVTNVAVPAASAVRPGAGLLLQATIRRPKAISKSTRFIIRPFLRDR